MVIDKKRCPVYAELFGEGKAWHRGSMIGRGNSAFVFLAMRKSTRYSDQYPPVMAVKSCDFACHRYLRGEDTVLDKIGSCPYVIKYLGTEWTYGEGITVYNLLFEYASGGSLAEMINVSRSGLRESLVKEYTWTILKGLNHVHRSGYVHNDLKPDNIFMVAREGETGFIAKIGDFGFSKKVDCESNKRQKLDVDLGSEMSFKGTINYLPPEAVKYGVQEPSSDIWALGCMVLEMLTGTPAWQMGGELDDLEVLEKIKTVDELPKIPSELSEDAKDFIRLCLVRDRRDRCGAGALLRHKFVLNGLDDDDHSDQVVGMSDNNYDGHEEAGAVDKYVDDKEVEEADTYADDEEVEEADRYADDEEIEEADRYADDEEFGEAVRYADYEEVEEADWFANDEEVEEPDGYADDEEVEEADGYADDEEAKEGDMYADDEEAKEVDRYADDEETEDVDRFADDEEAEEVDRFGDDEEAEEVDRYADDEEAEEVDMYADEEDLANVGEETIYERSGDGFNDAEGDESSDMYESEEEEEEEENVGEETTYERSGADFNDDEPNVYGEDEVDVEDDDTFTDGLLDDEIEVEGSNDDDLAYESEDEEEED